MNITSKYVSDLDKSHTTDVLRMSCLVLALFNKIEIFNIVKIVWFVDP